MTKRSRKGLGMHIPGDEAELDASIAAIAASQRAIDDINSHAAALLSHLIPVREAVDEEIRRIQVGQLLDIADHSQSIANRLAGIGAFVEARWGRLAKKRTIAKRATGIIRRQRDSIPQVQIEDEDQVLKRLQELGLTEFIHVTTTINVEAMLANREAAEAIEGVTFVDDEILIVLPVGGRKTSITMSEVRRRADVAA